MMQLTQSAKGQGSSRTSSRGKLAVLSQAFPCSLSHRPGQVCQRASGTPAVVVWTALTAFPPLTAGSGCSQQPLALLPLQKLQLTSSGVTWCPKKYKSVISSHAHELLFPAQQSSNLYLAGDDSTWYNSMENQSICTASLKVRDMKTSFWKVS